MYRAGTGGVEVRRNYWWDKKTEPSVSSQKKVLTYYKRPGETVSSEGNHFKIQALICPPWCGASGGRNYELNLTTRNFIAKQQRHICCWRTDFVECEKKLCQVGSEWHRVAVIRFYPAAFVFGWLSWSILHLFKEGISNVNNICSRKVKTIAWLLS